ncbi:MAG TPA: AhpC/TSA family protein [Sphingomicrobium sp.]|nr:AhpC/TSA family protein [Sphingomicrobium sp.]
MSRLLPGERSPILRLNAADDALDLASGNLPTHLQFRRFAGCPVCSLHIASFRRRADELRPVVREVMIFHSTIGEIDRYVHDLPFHVVADPTKRIYRAFGVENGRAVFTNPLGWPAILRSVTSTLARVLNRTAAFPPLSPLGGRLSLPADFLIAADGMVAAVHYGKHVDDSWSVDEVLEQARRQHPSAP